MAVSGAIALDLTVDFSTEPEVIITWKGTLDGDLLDGTSRCRSARAT